MVLAEDLRQAVFQAALQGKLTEQLESDSDVDEMLENIVIQKKNLLNRKKAREEKKIPIMDDEEKPYDIPDNWCWEKLGNIGVYKKGPFGSALTKSIFVPKGQNTVKVYEQKNAIQKDASLGEYYITKEYFDSKMKGFIVESGDIIVSCAGTIGETYIMPTDIEFGIINQALMRMNIVDSVNIDYFLLYFNNILKLEARKGSKGSAIKNIPPFDVFKKMLIPLPPIEEQQRIVDKINEIMPKIDEYEKIEKELEALKKEFPLDMKDALLQAAMQGKLTEQLESDSSVDELLITIQKEKEALIAQKKIKKEKLLSDIEEEEIQFDIPENWRWVRLSEIGEIIGGGTPKTSQVEFWDNGNIAWITPADMSGYGRYIKRGEKNITQLGLDGSSAKLFSKGSVIISSRAPIGYIAIAQNEASTSQGCKTFSAYLQDLILSEFIYYAMQFRIPDMEKRATGTTFKEISGNGVGETIIPLPPIEEQQRIVERLDALLLLCEDLKEK